MPQKVGSCHRKSWIILPDYVLRQMNELLDSHIPRMDQNEKKEEM
jgi:hypothetical protein